MKMGQRGESAKARILIVEDDTPLAMMMVNVLTQAGCDVLVANSGKKGTESVQEGKFDLIVLAVDLPDISGFEICNELQQRHASRHTPTVLISKRPCEDERLRSLECGAVDYIPKPFEAGDFTSRILSHVKESATT